MKEMKSAYEAKEIEEKLTRFWEENRFFEAKPESKRQPFSMVMPPPNVTGVLHMGHALVTTIQDVLTRFKRMQGYDALFIPGTDHAGIATQTVVERMILKEEGKTRHDMPREALFSRIMEWKEVSEASILKQIKRLGASCDFTKYAFSMDEKRSCATRTLFKRLYDDGFIERGDYLVNWDPLSQTALSDDEVEYEDAISPLYTIAYPIKGEGGFIQVATTRPETLLGDTAIAVHPEDSRYRSLIGKEAILPLTNRSIPIIQDPFVDQSFGTGAVKVTPAHDPNDYDIGQRHSLPMINIMTTSGKINENGGKYEGLSMEEAREAVAADLEAKKLLISKKMIQNRIGISYRSKAKIEPFLSKQWFIRIDRFKETLKSMVLDGETSLVPKNYEKTFFHWIEKLRPWCISRQLVWGHRIPVWFNKKNPSEILVSDEKEGPEEVKNNPEQWLQDEDVLDTWFSSAAWPFSTLGWPEKEAPDYKRYYPLSVLVTGHDILFFWVARMMFMGKYITGETPFHDVFLHGLIYGKTYFRQSKDGEISYASNKERTSFENSSSLPEDVFHKWEKMSKSKGNVLDPLQIIDEYGADAMRFALLASSPLQREIDLDKRKFIEYRNFVNKIWNGARFIHQNLFQEGPLDPALLEKGLNPALFSLEDFWILAALQKTINSVCTYLEEYQIDQAAAVAYAFYWGEFCAYYLEIAKPVLNHRNQDETARGQKKLLLLHVLSSSCALMHPFAPFITEELFQHLRAYVPSMTSKEPLIQETLNLLGSKSLSIASFPKEGTIDQASLEKMEAIKEIVLTVRQLLAEMKCATCGIDTLYFISEEPENDLTSNAHLILALTRVRSVSFVQEAPRETPGSTAIVGAFRLFLPLPKELIEQEVLRLEKERGKLQLSLEKTNQELKNEHFLEKAPKELVDQKKAVACDLKEKLAFVSEKLQEYRETAKGGQ